ncbi:hypothetical protein IEN92_03695 [Polynucleobacter sp. MWH-Creno-3A4]|uniref:hypothetical protein n=1 Tax=Polynucleobacter sp. MWH-Creno-3A4 TaxID=1855886 RepID=UPI001C0B05E4|nr:hypothetical protein [Polynucleobacter sp. MWH-Creno-3A4]MBU3605856.1 hypothetical protein [Polynucleobacter sp. MWH-Creno-3A4]
MTYPNRVVNTFRTLFPKKAEVFSDIENKCNEINGINFKKIWLFLKKFEFLEDFLRGRKTQNRIFDAVFAYKPHPRENPEIFH